MHGAKLYLKSRAEPYLSFRPYIDLMRPMTMLPAFVVGFVGGIIVHLAFIDALMFGLLLTLMQAGGQALNQSNPAEIKIDEINGKKYRPTVSGAILPANARRFAYAILFTAFLFSIALHVWIYGLFMLMLAATYTEQPFYLKRIFPLNLIVQAVSRGFLPIYTLGIISGINTLPLAVFSMFWVFGLQSTKDFNDIEGDRQYGIKTLPVLIGRSASQFVMFLISVMDYGYAIYIGLWFLIFLLPLDILSIIKAGEQSRFAENSKGWVYFYASLGIGTVMGLAGIAGVL
jgi:4-hydroxybenzoate polyprenyltransferase